MKMNYTKIIQFAIHTHGSLLLCVCVWMGVCVCVCLGKCECA